MGRKKVEINDLSKERLKLLCERKKISQKDLADATGYTSHTISQIVTGQKGLSSQFADAIVKAYPDVSRKWLLGDPNAKMSSRESLFLHYKDTHEKLEALEALLVFTEFKIDFEHPYDIEGIHDKFYNIYYGDTAVAITEKERDTLVNTIINMIESFLKWLVENGKSARELGSQYSEFGLHYLDDFCDFILYEADTDFDEKDKDAISHFVRYVDQCIGQRSQENFMYPKHNESDVVQKEFKEFLDK